MNKDPRIVLLGLIAGLEETIICLADSLARQSGVSREELAADFRARADTVAQRSDSSLMALMLGRVAEGLESHKVSQVPLQKIVLDCLQGIGDKQT